MADQAVSTASLFTPTKSVNDEEEQNPKDKKAEYILQQAFSEDSLEMKTDIAPKSIVPLTKLLIFHREFKSDLAKDLAYTIMSLSISKKRGGRKEMTEMLRPMYSDDPGMETGGLASRLLGGV